MKIDKKTIITGYISQLLIIVYSFFSIIISSIYLNQSEVSLWMIFLTYMGLSFVLDFGFSPIIIRKIASTFSCGKQNINHKMELGAFKEIRSLYLKLSIFGIIICTIIGYFYIYEIIVGTEVSNGMIAWLIFSVAFCVNIYYLYTQPVLSGTGNIFHTNITNIIMRATWLLLSIVGLMIYESILTLAVTYFIGIIVARVYAIKIIKNKLTLKETPNYEKEFIKKITPLAWKMGGVILCAYVINKSVIYFSGYHLGLKGSTEIIFSFQILFAINAIALVYNQMHLPMLSNLIKYDKKNAVVLYKKILKFSLTSYAIISVFIYFSLNTILLALGLPMRVLEGKYLIIIIIIGLLELNHSIASSYIVSTNRVPFLPSAILTATGIVVFYSFILKKIEYSEVMLLILGMGIPQLLYNNWVWSYQVYRENKGV